MNDQIEQMQREAAEAHKLKADGRSLKKYVGRQVKKGFDVPRKYKRRIAREWMWIDVKTVQGSRLIGELINEPVFVKLKYGDIVEFTEQEIEFVVPTNEAKP